MSACAMASGLVLVAAANAQNFEARAAENPQSVVRRFPDVSIAYPESSIPTGSIPDAAEPRAPLEHPIVRPLFPAPARSQPDPLLANITAPTSPMPAPILNFPGQGHAVSPGTIQGPLPPDANGAAGPNHYVQLINRGYMIWNKSGTVVQASRFTNTLWAGYTGTNAGNGCSIHNDGGAIVLYDQIADRWFITQYSQPNLGSPGGPSFQCVAVSKTGDPTGAYWLYDFQYNYASNAIGKFAVWPDAYYAAFNFYDAPAAFLGVCAYDRARMLNGQPATQQCFVTPSPLEFGLLPANVDGRIQPPRGEPGFVMKLGRDANQNFNGTLSLFKFHVDWATPANSTLTGPTSIPVAAFAPPCFSMNASQPCIQQPPPGSLLRPMGEQLMFRLTYRNFGTHESIVVNHTVTANATSGVRWYEIRSPNGTPVVFQQGTHGPNDGKWRWMASIAQDQAQDIVAGYSVSSSTSNPAIAWAGRVASDAPGTLAQTEAVVAAGAGVETGAAVWGDYTAMSIDPTDDCTFWYTNELYDTTGQYTWDTRIASVRFPNCAANDFLPSVTPGSRSIFPGSETAYTVNTALTAGGAESIVLNVQDLPTGVTGAFVPASITAGSSATLTLTASAGAPLGTPVTFTVIATAPSAVHAATAQVWVGGPPSAPTNVAAAAATSTQVSVTWTAALGATSYDVFRKAPGQAFAFLVNTGAASYSDNAVSADTSYLYKVQAKNGSGNSSDSNIDLATTTVFTDDPIVPGSTIVRAEHLLQLRTAVNAVRALAGLTAATFATEVQPGTLVHAIDITELRSALDPARSALSLPALAYTNSAAAGTVINAVDFMEIRNGMR
jgi:hypothetical protein